MSLYLGNDLISGNKPINLGVRNIGEIVASPLPLTDAGLHLLDGSLILGGGIYQGFVDYIADLYTANPSANYFTTEALWQQSVTTYGVCGKFVYDSVNNTVRLPKVTGIIEGTTDATALGDLVEASYPSHYHYIVNNDRVAASASVTISATNYLTCRAHNTAYDESYTFQGTDTVATLGKTSNSGSGSTVQPQTIKAFYYIVVATSSKTDIQVDIDEIATDLNGKADVDLTNSSPSISFATAMDNAGIRTVVETYQNGTSWYRVYSDGWCEQGGGLTTTGTVTFLKPFINTNITLTMTRNSNYQGSISAGFHGSWTSVPTTTGFTCYYDSNTAYSWCARGYIR